MKKISKIIIEISYDGKFQYRTVDYENINEFEVVSVLEVIKADCLNNIIKYSKNEKTKKNTTIRNKTW